ncbi:MAG: hypothetical protein A2297_05470 [Elusimicrobia bacterium RIFOXYB2_FULL_48_7]|nr:MAG: hypothetical protein A2297_05470 [Elusimicrobia bacterium RIFOXYB2_FULL_48_7]
MNSIETSNLTKTFRTGAGKIEALSSVNISIPASSITALTGPNGAGKTTLLKMLSGLVLQTSGTMKITGKIGLAYNPETSFYPQLTLKENLSFFGALFRADTEKTTGVCSQLELTDYLNTKFVFCSSGIRQRLALARALLNSPEILLVDEPTKSLDAQSAGKILSLLSSVNKQQGTTILFATHNENEIEKLSASRIRLKNGKIEQ